MRCAYACAHILVCTTFWYMTSFSKVDAFSGSVTVADELVGVVFVDLRRRTAIKGIRTALAGIDEDRSVSCILPITVSRQSKALFTFFYIFRLYRHMKSISHSRDVIGAPRTITVLSLPDTIQDDT